MCQCNSNNINVSCVSCAVNPPSVQSGTSGVGVSSATITNGDLIITLTNGVVINAGNVEGTNGLGIDSITYNNNNQLEITYTDNTVQTFTLKDKTFFIASTEASTVDVLNNSLVAPNVISGDTRFNLDTGSFQIFDGTSWTLQLSIGNRLTFNLKELDSSATLPLFYNVPSGVASSVIISKILPITTFVNNLEIGEALKLHLAGIVTSDFLTPTYNVLTVGGNRPFLQLDFNQGASVLVNPLASNAGLYSSAFKAGIFIDHSDLKIGEYPLHFKWEVIITKSSATNFIFTTSLIRDFQEVGYNLYIGAGSFIGQIVVPKVNTQIVTLNTGLVLNFNLLYVNNNSSVPATANGIRLTDFNITKIQK